MHNFTYNRILTLFTSLLCLNLLLGLSSCDDDTEFTPPVQENPSKAYFLNAKNDSQVAGYVKFTKIDDNTTEALIVVGGTESGNTHPAHIHANSAAEGGDIAIDFEPVNGATGRSTTTIPSSTISYDDLLNYDGYVNVHLSESDLTVVSQTDIGGNELTGTTKEYPLSLRDNSGTTGSVLFAQRKNGNTLATITLDSLQNLSATGSYPAHIHSNSAVEGGGIVIPFNSVSGSTGTSVTHIEATEDGTPISYEGLVGTEDAPGYDGYVNVHESADNLATLIVQGDIGSNELTGESATYALSEKDMEGINGEAKFEERKSGETLVTLTLEGTPEGGVHPAHIHANTAVQGGGIVISFNPVNGTTGMSMTNVAVKDDGAPITYEELVGTDDAPGFDGYINVHLSAAELGTIVAQGDIGQNTFTGESVTYALDSIADPDIKGTATLQERSNGTTLVTLALEGTSAGGVHPAHIHANTAAEGGAITIDLTSVDGATGTSLTEIDAFNDGTAVSYSDLLGYDGYINVHLSAENLATIVAQGDIGQNALTDEEVTYPLVAIGNSGVSGTATFAERTNGTALVTLVLTGTSAGGNHPAHIHYNSAAEGGAIAISLTNVDGATGISKTSVVALDNNLPITYEELVGTDETAGFDGYVNVHLSSADLATIVAQGDIGANVAE